MLRYEIKVIRGAGLPITFKSLLLMGELAVSCDPPFNHRGHGLTFENEDQARKFVDENISSWQENWGADFEVEVVSFNH